MMPFHQDSLSNDGNWPFSCTLLTAPFPSAPELGSFLPNGSLDTDTALGPHHPSTLYANVIHAIVRKDGANITGITAAHSTLITQLALLVPIELANQGTSVEDTAKHGSLRKIIHLPCVMVRVSNKPHDLEHQTRAKSLAIRRREPSARLRSRCSSILPPLT